MVRPADEVSITPELNTMLGLDKTSRQWKMILSLRDRLYENRLTGIPYEKKRIPKFYRDRYDVNNLYYCHFPGGYRACYTLKGIDPDTDEICAVILDLMTHKEYEKRFGYAGS